MQIKEIRNSKDGNNIESIIYDRINRHIFMLYSMKPLQDIKIQLLSVTEHPYIRKGLYVYLVSEALDFMMRIPEEMIFKMITQEFYTPFHEDSIRPLLKQYMDEVENYKNLKAKGVHFINRAGKVLMQIHFAEKKKGVLKRVLEALGL